MPDVAVNVAVIGVGSFGRNHARVYHELEDEGRSAVRLVAIVDSDVTRAQQIAQQYGAAAFGSVEQLVSAIHCGQVRVDAASVAAPTSHHLSVAAALMDSGVDVLIEKPVAVDVEQVMQLEAIAAQTKRVAMVGQLERFNPAVRAVLNILNNPMFFECHRLSIFTPRSLDVDVVLDLMIHDLDVVLAMVKSDVREVRAVGLPVLTGKTDIANVRVEFENGCVANFTASRVSTERVRKMRLFQPHEYLSIDYGRQDVIRIQVDEQVLAMMAMMKAGQPELQQQVPSAAQRSAGVNISKPPVEPGEPLRAELESFISAVRGRSVPEVTLADGGRALALALDIHQKIEEHRMRAGLI